MPGAHPLDEFAPGHGVTTTTITGNHGKAEKNFRSRSSSQEQLASPVDKITKHFVIEYDDRSSEEVRQESPESQVERDRARVRSWSMAPRRS